MEKNSAIDLSDAFDFLSFDNQKDFLIKVRCLPEATAEMNAYLLRSYRDGSSEALAMLVKTNLRLIVNEANKIRVVARRYSFLDLIQDGVEEFIRSANDYDFSRADEVKFSTFAVNNIRMHLIKVLKDNDYEIRRPRYLFTPLRKYENILASSIDSGTEMPSDEELKAKLKIKSGTLKIIKNDFKYNPVSLNARLKNDDDDNCSYSDFVSDGTNVSDQVINDLAQRELFIYLKRKLPAYSYYILMMRILKKIKLEEIAKNFEMTYPAVQHREKQAYAMLRELCSEDQSFQYHFDPSITATELSKMGFYLTHPDDIVKYMFFRDALTDIERNLFRIYIEGYYIRTPEIFAELLGLKLDEYLNVKKSLVLKLTSMMLESKENFNSFRLFVLKRLHTKIYDVDWDMEFTKYEKSMESGPKI